MSFTPKRSGSPGRLAGRGGAAEGDVTLPPAGLAHVCLEVGDADGNLYEIKQRPALL